MKIPLKLKYRLGKHYKSVASKSAGNGRLTTKKAIDPKNLPPRQAKQRYDPETARGKVVLAGKRWHRQENGNG